MHMIVMVMLILFDPFVSAILATKAKDLFATVPPLHLILLRTHHDEEQEGTKENVRQGGW
jgi:hypothetical protein